MNQRMQLTLKRFCLTALFTMIGSLLTFIIGNPDSITNPGAYAVSGFIAVLTGLQSALHKFAGWYEETK